ncbi:MAG: gamma-glutamyltransferase [Deltaproteobacteria bacterium]|nr:gamma-glutamyltransferase [Deltaproteobacteria bacterium]
MSAAWTGTDRQRGRFAHPRLNAAARPGALAPALLAALAVALWCSASRADSTAGSRAQAPQASAPAAAALLDVAHAAVAAEHRLASQAGVEILRAGGNAVDAAVAAALASGVVNPVSSGLGGGGFLVLWNAAEARAHTLDFRETAPRAASPAMYLRADGSVDTEASRTGGRAVAVPGEPRGLAWALAHFGRLSRARVAAPAIRLARDGFTVESHLASMLAKERDRIAADPALAAVFLHAGGSAVGAGETLRRPDLAATLELFAREGGEPFHVGPLAADIVAAVSARGGSLTLEDLAGWRPLERTAVITSYRGLRVIGMPPPSSGGGVVAEALEVLEAYDLGALGPGGVTWLHLLGETCKAVFADRAALYGDPAFTPIPLRRLLAPPHAIAIRSRLRAATAVPSSIFGELAAAPDDSGTSHVSVIDADGNAAALTTSINTAFGAAVSVPGRDLLLNNTMDDFAARPGVANAFGIVGSRANQIAPGKRPLSSMSPTIVVEGGRVRLVVGASGGPVIITSTLQALVDVIDFGQDVAAAVSAPRVHHQWLPETLFVEEAVPAGDKTSLAKLGHRIAALTGKSSVQAVEVTRPGGRRRVRAASDPRKGGAPAGY